MFGTLKAKAKEALADMAEMYVPAGAPAQESTGPAQQKTGTPKTTVSFSEFLKETHEGAEMMRRYQVQNAEQITADHNARIYGGAQGATGTELATAPMQEIEAVGFDGRQEWNELIVEGWEQFEDEAGKAVFKPTRTTQRSHTREGSDRKITVRAGLSRAR